MQTNEQGSTQQTDPAAVVPDETGTKVEPVAETATPEKTTPLSEAEIDELKRLAKDGQNYKGAMERLEEENSELKTEVEDLSQRTTSVPVLGQVPDGMSEEEAKGIERDFKRQSRDLLARNKEIKDLTPKQRKEFDKQYQLQSSLVYQESLKRGEYVPVSDLESSFDTVLRFVKGVTNEEELKKARLQGQTEMLDRDAGNVGNTSQSTTERKVDTISPEALAQAQKSPLVQEGLATVESLAKRIQKRIDEGR